MATENQPAAAGSAAPTTPAAEPAKPVDPRAAALAVLNGGAAPAVPKEGASSTPSVAGSSPSSPNSSPLPKPGATPAPGGSNTPGEGETPAAVADPAKPQQDERLSAGFAKLARDKADLLKRENDLKARASAFEKWQADQEKIKADPAYVLDLHGLNIEQVAEAFLRRQAGQTEPTPEERIAALEQEKAARQKLEDDARKKAEDETAAAQAKQVHEAGVKVVVDVLDAATFPTIVALGEHEQAFEALSAYAKRHNLSPEQITTDVLKLVAVGVEQALADEYRGVIEKVPHIAKREPVPTTEKPATGQPTASGAQGTSSTSLASSEVSGAPAPQPGRRYTKEELRAAALAHFGPDA